MSHVTYILPHNKRIKSSVDSSHKLKKVTNKYEDTSIPRVIHSFVTHMLESPHAHHTGWL